jgi:ProP effector
MSRRRAETKTVVAELAARFPKCFAVPDSHRRPLKIGIDADVMAALGETVPRTELVRALAMYCNSEGYLARVLSGVPRVDLKGKPAGIVTADDEKHAKAKRAQIRAKRNFAPSVTPQDVKHVSASEPKAESPKRLSLTDLREAARRRRNE